MAKAEYTGIEQISELLMKHPIEKLELKKASKTVYIDQKYDGETSEDVLNRFINDFALKQPESNFATYSMDLTFKKPNAKRSDRISPDIAFNFPPGGEYINPYKKKESTPSPIGDLGFTSREFIEASTRMHILADENARLKAELDALEAENEELETQIPSGEGQPQNIGAVLSNALYANADKIIAVLADRLFGTGGSPAMSLSGVESDVNSLVNQMMLIEPEFPSHLEMLINLRKHKPAIYSMALNQLKSL